MHWSHIHMILICIIIILAAEEMNKEKNFLKWVHQGRGVKISAITRGFHLKDSQVKHHGIKISINANSKLRNTIDQLTLQLRTNCQILVRFHSIIHKNNKIIELIHYHHLEVVPKRSFLFEVSDKISAHAHHHRLQLINMVSLGCRSEFKRFKAMPKMISMNLSTFHPNSSSNRNLLR